MTHKLKFKILQYYLVAFMAPTIIFGSKSGSLTISGSNSKTGYWNNHDNYVTMTLIFDGSDATVFAGGLATPLASTDGGITWDQLENLTTQTMDNPLSSWTYPTNIYWYGSITATYPSITDGSTLKFAMDIVKGDFSGRDTVAVSSYPGGATQLEVRRSRPYFTNIVPNDDEYLNSETISYYAVTYDIINGTATFTSTSGTDEGTVYTESLTSDETTLNQHTDVNLGTFSLINGSIYSFELDGEDIYGNDAWHYSSTGDDPSDNVTFDSERPTVLSVTSSTNNGTYGIGSAIAFKISFSESVQTNNGTLVTTFDTGAEVNLGSNLATLYNGSYTVTEGEESTDLSVSNLDMSLGGTLIDIATNSMSDFSIPNSQNIDDSKAIIIDGVRPYVTNVTTSTATGTYGIDDIINITVAFSEPVSLASGTMDIVLETGSAIDATVTIAAADIDNSTSVSGSFTVVDGMEIQVLSVNSITDEGSDISDQVGNANTNLNITGNNLTNATIEIETTKPEIEQITTSASNNTYGIDSEIELQVDFTEDINLTGTITVTLETDPDGDDDYSVTLSSVTNDIISGTYTVLEGHDSNNGALQVKSVVLSSGTLTDDVGNPVALGGGNTISIPNGENLSDNKNIIIEAVRPTVTMVTSTTDDGTTKIIDNEILITVNFDEPVTLSGGNLEVTLETGSVNADAVVIINTIADNTTGTGTYTVRENDETTDLTVTGIALGSNASLVDAAQNDISSTGLEIPVLGNLSDSKEFVIDGIRPYITSIAANVSYNTYHKLNDDIMFDLNFSQSVTLAGGSEITTLSTGTTNRQVTINSISGTSASITYTVQSGDESDDLEVLSVQLSSGTLTSGSGNSVYVDGSNNLTLPSGNNLNDNNAIVVDGNVPAIDRVGSVITSGGNVEAGYWNSTNTSVDITVPMDGSDGSLVGGSVQLMAKVDAGSYANLGSEETILSSNVSSETKIITINAATLEAIGFTEGGDASFKAIITDVAGNAVDFLVSNTMLSIDQTLPGISAASSTNDPDIYIIDESINVTITFDVPVTLDGGDLEILLNTGQTITIPAANIINATSGSTGYTVLSGDNVTALDVVSVTVNSGGQLVDVAGNPMTIPVTNFTNINISDTKTIELDGIAPTQYTLGDITTNGGTVITDYWNDSNTGISVVVPLNASDFSLTDGEIQLKGKLTTDDSYSSIGSPATITLSDRQTGSKSITATEADMSALLITQGGIIEFIATVNDEPGNSIDYFASASTLTVDTQNPTAQTVSTVTTTGGTIVPNYWNGTNSGVSVTVPLEVSDNTLIGGEVYLQAIVGAGSEFDTVGAAVTISGADLTNGFVTATASATGTSYTDLKELSSWLENNYLRFNAAVYDIAGNSIQFLESVTTLLIDETLPQVDNVFSISNDGYYMEGDSIIIIMHTGEAVNIGLIGTPQLTLETGSTDAIVNYSSGSGTDSLRFIYEVGFGQSSSSLDYITASPFNLNGSTITDDAGNDMDIALPLPGSGSLADNTDFVIDTQVPTASISLDPDSLYREGETVNIIVNYSESMDITPSVQVDFAGGTIEGPYPMTQAETDSIWLKNVSIPTGNDGAATITVTGNDLAGNSLTNGNTTGRQLLRVDNTAPVLSQLAPISGSFVNHTNVSYQISETVASGSITWTWTGGTIDEYSHAVNLDASGLVGGFSYEDVALSPIPPLVDGSIYTLTWSMTDSAGNPSDNYLLTSILYDTTAPTGDLTYSHYFANEDTIVTITATFGERLLPVPQISIDYQGANGDITLVDMAIVGVDSAIWAYNAVVPGGLTNNGIASVSISSTDLALNSIGAGDLSFTDTLMIDNTDPIVTLTYSDSLVKENDVDTVFAAFSEEISGTPQISIDYAGGTTMNPTDMELVNQAWIKEIIIPDGNDGPATITISAQDLAGSPITNANTINRTLLRVDNTHPSFTLLSPDTGEYVNHSLVGYRLSETSFSGNVRWEQTVGNTDTTHTVDLTPSELQDSFTFTDYTLTNGPNNLVSGATYSVTWSATDSAGNMSTDFISTQVHYDTTAPTGDLTYSHYFANEDTTVTITATFGEPLLPVPQISIDYQGSNDDITLVDMTIGADSAIWTYNAAVPGGLTNNGIASVSISGTDLALNSLRASDLINADTLIVDNSPPSVTFTYTNNDQSNLVNLGKSGDAIRITASFTDVIVEPVINIQYADSTDDSIENLTDNGSAANDSIWYFDITLPEESINSGSITLSSTSKDRAGNQISTFINNNIFEIDNDPPTDFITGTVEPIGSNTVTGWLNSLTNSLEIDVPIASNDPSLLFGGDVAIEMFIKNRSVDWTSIGSPDSILTAGNFTVSRAAATLLDSLSILSTGDTILIRASINDKVGNITVGDTSASILVYDPNPPEFGGALLGTNPIDTLRSTDEFTITWNSFTEPTLESGINYYEYAMDTDGVGDTTGFSNWTEVVDDTTITAIKTLTHDSTYNVYIRCYDIAGNISIVENPDPQLHRLNSAPIITQIDTVFGFEDITYSESVNVTDADDLTILEDLHKYYVETTKPNGSPVLSEIIIDSLTGELSWLPTQADTGTYRIDIIVNDNWGFSDSIIFYYLVEPVNDSPVLNISAPDSFITFAEDKLGTDSILVNLSQYASDVDDSLKHLSWQVVILQDTATYTGFPMGQVIVGPGTPNSLRNYLKNKYAPRQLLSSKSTDSKQLTWINSIEEYVDSLHVELLVRNDSTWAFIYADTNYYTNTNRQIIIYTNDVEGLSADDTISIKVTPENDPPVWSTIGDQLINENDSLIIDLTEFVTDVDDSLLTFKITGLTNSDKMTIPITLFSSTTHGDSVLFIPDKLWSDTARIQVIAFDRNYPNLPFKSDTTEFTIDVLFVPRPAISMWIVQNNAFSNFYKIFITDSARKTTSLILKVQSDNVPLDTVGAYTYVGNHSFIGSGTYTFNVIATGIVGETDTSSSVGLTLARMNRTWSGSSSDGVFGLQGKPGSVGFDQSFMILDSSMFDPSFYDRASYLIGNEAMSFEDPVLISFKTEAKDIAVYRRDIGISWQELPSMTIDGGVVSAYSDRMGYYRLGPKTIFVPGETDLGNNYPNPFNPFTNIVFDIGFMDGPRQKATVSVYNIRGQQIATLYNDYIRIGRHTIRWDSKTDRGTAVASGIYFVQLSTNSGINKTKKVLLVR